MLAALAGKYTEIATYDTGTQNYRFYNPNAQQDFTTLQPGKGYLIYILENCSIEVTGTPVQPNQSLLSGWNLVAANVNASLPIEESLATAKNQIKTIWYYNTENSEWQRYAPSQSKPSYLNDLYTGDPGKSYWINASSNTRLDFVDPTKEKTIYYHPDHLGSTSLTTDEKGAVVSETAYYPFGRPRYQQTADGKGSYYKYTGKELDQTGLFYYEARYMDPVIGKFVTVDPLFVNINKPVKIDKKYAGKNISSRDQKRLNEPFNRIINDQQELNLYSYTLNNPTNFIDPTGLRVQPRDEMYGCEDEDWCITKIRKKELRRESKKNIHNVYRTGVKTGVKQGGTRAAKGSAKALTYLGLSANCGPVCAGIIAAFVEIFSAKYTADDDTLYDENGRRKR